MANDGRPNRAAARSYAILDGSGRRGGSAVPQRRRGWVMADDEDYYAILGVPTDADQERIRLAFRHLARLYHPDVAGTGDVVRMQRLTAAYRTLGDPERR